MLKSVLLTLILVCSGSHQHCFSKNPPVNRPQRDAWIASYHNFSASLFKALNRAVDQEDIFFSPLGIYEGLLLAYFGATRKTNLLLAEVLQLPKRQSKAVSWKFYKELKLLRDQDNTYPLKIANRIYLSDELYLFKCMKNRFEEELEQIDLENVFYTRSCIREWVEEETHGYIADLLTNISPFSTAELINVAYLGGKWEKEFNHYLTVALPFHVGEWHTTLIKMMYRFDKHEEGYSSELEARLLRLPYEGGEIAMIILLPVYELDSMIESMNINTIKYISDRRNYKSAYSSIFIPRFRKQNHINILYALRMLGVGNSFTKFSDYSYFTGKKEVFLESFNHVAGIEVIETDDISTPKKLKNISHYRPFMHEDFTCDRPFAYVIYDYSAQKTIFMGTFRDPKPISIRKHHKKSSQM